MMSSLGERTYLMYRDGVRAMVLGRVLWKIILLKLFIIFAVLKVFFFPDYLGSRFASDHERASFVLDRLSNPPVRP